MAVKFVQANLALWGVTTPETVVIKGHNQYPECSQEIIANGLENVTKVAAKF